MQNIFDVEFRLSSSVALFPDDARFAETCKERERHLGEQQENLLYITTEKGIGILFCSQKKGDYFHLMSKNQL